MIRKRYGHCFFLTHKLAQTNRRADIGSSPLRDRCHRPKWAKSTFESSEIDAECPSDDEVKELVKLIHDGHAKVLSNVAHMHVTTKVTSTLLGAIDSYDEEEDGDEGSGDEGGKKKKAKH